MSENKWKNKKKNGEKRGQNGWFVLFCYQTGFSFL